MKYNRAKAEAMHIVLTGSYRIVTAIYRRIHTKKYAAWRPKSRTRDYGIGRNGFPEESVKL